MYFKTLIIFLVYISAGRSQRLPIPTYLKRCSISAPDFDDCCLRNGREAIPSVLKGDKKYGIPPMLPLVIPKVSLDSGPEFSLTLTDLHIYGLEAGKLNKIKFDLKNKKTSGQLYADKFDLRGQYDVNGRILIIPIQGKGDINITTVGFTIDYNNEYVLEEKNGAEYISITKGAVDYSMKRAHFQLSNLFNGNKELGESTNKVLNDEWEQVLASLRPVITETIVKIVNSIINAVTSHVPYKEIFLD